MRFLITHCYTCEEDLLTSQMGAIVEVILTKQLCKNTLNCLSLFRTCLKLSPINPLSLEVNLPFALVMKQ